MTLIQILQVLVLSLVFGSSYIHQKGTLSNQEPAPAVSFHKGLPLPPIQFADLPQGKTAYRLYGPADGRLVVMIHGFALPSDWVWPETATELANKGYRVLTYDLYGRGHSDAPEVNNELALFTNQLSSLLFYTGLTYGKPFDIVAVSMGGAITAAFSASYKHHIRSVYLAAPAGLIFVTPPETYLMKLPALGEVLVRFLGPQSLAKHVEDGFYNSHQPEIQKEAKKTSAYAIQQNEAHPGYERSLLSTMRHFEWDKCPENYQKMANSTTFPVHFIWGEEDIVVPFSGLGVAKGFFSGQKRAEFLQLPATGHEIVRAKEFLPSLLRFLDQSK